MRVTLAAKRGLLRSQFDWRNPLNGGESVAPETKSLNKIEHIVVLMFENRSFDNLLGWLYDPENEALYDKVPQNFEGLSGKKLSNRAPDGRIVPAGKTLDPRGPQPNPGEPYQDVYSQLYDVPLMAAKDVPPHPSPTANMQGFIRNYADQKEKPKDPANIMNSLTPKTVPVISALAHNYAVFDHWFASIPTQTFCNRSFVHAGTSSGYVNNGGGGLCFVNETPTIFDLLEGAGKSWKIYCGSWLLESFTLLTQKRLWKYAVTEHLAHFKEFVAAAGRKGGLPNYSFIEPIYFDSIVWGAQTDMHPESNLYEFYGPANLHKGEALLWTVYDAIRNSPDWESTLLIVLFDEHGGCYDHVPPPTSSNCKVAINPSGDGKVIPADQPGGTGFNFDRLGARVPAIAISAYTPPQTRINSVFEHTSVLSTVVNCFALPKNQLGLRQAAADDVSAALTLNNARTDKPFIAKPESSLLEDLKAEAHSIFHSRFLGAKQKPISDLQRSAMHGAALLMQDGDLHERIDKLQSEFEADLLLMEHEAKLVKDKVLSKFK
jgi:phospholipase C